MFLKLLELIQLDANEINPSPEVGAARHARGGFYLLAVASLIVATGCVFFAFPLIKEIDWSKSGQSLTSVYQYCGLAVVSVCLFVWSVLRLVDGVKRGNAPVDSHRYDSNAEQSKAQHNRAIIDNLRDYSSSGTEHSKSLAPDLIQIGPSADDVPDGAAIKINQPKEETLE